MQERSTTLLSQQQVQLYQTHGYLSGLRIAEEEEAARFRESFDHLEEQEGREKARIGLLDYHFEHPFLMEIATHPKILDCMASLLGPNLLLLATHFFCKYGQDEKFVAWHQDAAYWGLIPPCTATAWYAVDDSDEENGCMRVIAGSHRDGLREHGKAVQAGNLLSVNQEVTVTKDEDQHVVLLPLKAGEISIHDGALIHGSLSNRSSRRRCGLTLRYIPTSVQADHDTPKGSSWRPILVCGEDREQHFGTIPTAVDILSNQF